MKNLLALGCAAAAAMMLMPDTASAGCRYGGGGYYGGGGGISLGYSSYAPRSTFSVGYNSFPSYGAYRAAYAPRGNFGYRSTTVYRGRSDFQPYRGGRYRGRW